MESILGLVISIAVIILCVALSMYFYKIFWGIEPSNKEKDRLENKLHFRDNPVKVVNGHWFCPNCGVEHFEEDYCKDCGTRPTFQISKIKIFENLSWMCPNCHRINGNHDICEYCGVNRMDYVKDDTEK